MSFWKRLTEFLIGPASGVRARDSKGRFVKDDPSTPNVNEAYKDGRKPTKKRGRGRPKGSKNKTKAK